MAVSPTASDTTQAQIDGFIDRFTPEIAAQGRAALVKLQQRVPGATIMVYDNYNGLVFGFGPTPRAGAAILSLLFVPRWLTLCFLQGVHLADPDRLLVGSGNQVRHIRLTGPEHLDDPRIIGLIVGAIAQARPPIDPAAPGGVVIKSISAKQRARRPA